MDEHLQIIALAVLGAVWGLATLARRRPDIGWLRPFADAFPQLPHAQRERLRRRLDFYAGAELILLGIGLPLAAGALKVMFFSSISPIELAVVVGLSLLCLVLGIGAIASSRRRR